MKAKSELERRMSTREKAITLLEDLKLIQALISDGKVTSAQLRHVCVILRRILIEGELAEVASCRIGAIEILAPDNKPAYVFSRTGRLMIFVSGGADIGPVQARGLALIAGAAGSVPSALTGGSISLKCDRYRQQDVIFFDGKWINRHAVIKFAANIAGGAHHLAPTDAEHYLLGTLRASPDHAPRLSDRLAAVVQVARFT